jgi:hypothetical protein
MTDHVAYSIRRSLLFDDDYVFIIPPGVKRGRGVKLTARPLLVPRFRKSRSHTSSPFERRPWRVAGRLYFYVLIVYW